MTRAALAAGACVVVGALITTLAVLTGILMARSAAAGPEAGADEARAEADESGIYMVSPDLAPADSDRAFDILFVGDAGYSDDAFLTDVRTAIEDGFGRSEALALNMHLLNFWFTHARAAVGSSCPFGVALPDVAHTTRAEVVIVLHRSPMHDCAWGNRYATANVRSDGGPSFLIHEFSHAAFGLPDEYCCSGGYWPAPRAMYAEDEAPDPTPEAASSSDGSAWHPLQYIEASKNAASGAGRTWVRPELSDNVMYTVVEGAVLPYGRANWEVAASRLEALPGSTVASPTSFATPVDLD